jgi:hypothetical protein
LLLNQNGLLNICSPKQTPYARLRLCAGVATLLALDRRPEASPRMVFADR